MCYTYIRTYTSAGDDVGLTGHSVMVTTVVIHTPVAVKGRVCALGTPGNQTRQFSMPPHTRPTTLHQNFKRHTVERSENVLPTKARVACKNLLIKQTC